MIVLKRVECCCQRVRLTNKDLVRTKVEGERHAEIADMERKWIRYQHDDIQRLVGFRRATRPCAARTCIFRLINTLNGALRAPTPPIAASCFSFIPQK